MSRTYYAKNGTEFDANASGSELLSRLSLGLFSNKFGIPEKISKANTKIFARILRNFAHLQVMANSYKIQRDYLKEVTHIEPLDGDEIAWIRQAADFFDKSGGTVNEEDFVKKRRT